MSQQTASAEQEAAPARKALPLPARRQAARLMYEESVAAGMPMNDRELGEAFGLSARWGRDRVAEVRAELAKRAGFAEDVAPASAPVEEPDGEDQDDEPELPAAAGSAEPPVPVAAEPAPVAAESAPVVAVPAVPERDRLRVWPVLLLALPATVAIWSGWVELGARTGFGIVHPLPGIWDGFQLNTAITLPIGVETYAAYALRVWLSGQATGRARAFAKWSALSSLVLGGLGQVTMHLMNEAHMTAAPWWITTLVACLPVAVLGMGATLAHLIRDEHAEATA